jgi:HK97 gp10 family phage protein
MANFVEAKLNGDLELDLSKFEKIVTEKVLFSGAATMGKVIYDEVKLNASPPRLGRVTGKLQDAIYWVFSPEKSTDSQKTYRISWNKRKAPHGHLIEFGTSRSPAHPFLRPAFSRINDAIAQGKARMAQRLAEEI